MTAQPHEPHVGLVVEGRGDHGALPILLRAYLRSKGDFREILGRPIPANGVSNATKKGGIEGYVATAGARPGCKGVLVVLDSDDHCPASLGPSLLERVENVISQKCVVALARRNYEDWLYASIETLGLEVEGFDEGKNGLKVIKNALYPKAYAKPTWQPRLTSRMDLDLAASRSGSLRRLLIRSYVGRDE